MRLDSFKIRNYTSILDSGQILCNERFLVLAGKNNVGKTATIEAIYRCLQGSLNTPNSSASGSTEGIMQSMDNPVHIDFELSLNNTELENLFGDLEKVFWGNRVYMVMRSGNGQTQIIEFGRFTGDSRELLFQWDAPTSNWKRRQVEGDTITFGQGSYSFLTNLYFYLSKSIMYINGKRSVMGRQQINAGERLDTSASNLHSVLHALHNNSEERFDDISKTFKNIFPDVTRIRTSVDSNFTNASLVFEGADESIPLQECGTGFTHVLILLCLIHSDEEKIILFDEPHSFLHPSAEKAIYDISSKKSNHQFVFTSHSPILINYPTSKNLYLVRKAQGQSNYTLLNQVQQIFSELGIANADFAFSEKVIFVEGKTEETVLPTILEAFGIEQVGYNYKIISLEGSGNVICKPLTRNAKTFEKVFESISLQPIPYLILLDRDGKEDQNLTKLKEAYNNRVLILDRYEIENYFIDAKAITMLLNENGFAVSIIEIEDLISKIMDNRDNKEVYPKGCLNPIKDLQGSNVLQLVFEQFGMSYNKVQHGSQLVRFLLKERLGELGEVAEMLRTFIEC